MTFSIADVRAISFLSEEAGDELLARLSGDTAVLEEAGLMQSGPAESRPWFGALRMVRVPVTVASRRGAAVGYVDVQRVGAGTTEVRLSLHRTAHWRRPLGRRALDRLTHDILRRLTQTSDAASRSRPLSRGAARGTRRSSASAPLRTARPAPTPAPHAQA